MLLLLMFELFALFEHLAELTYGIPQHLFFCSLPSVSQMLQRGTNSINIAVGFCSAGLLSVYCLLIKS